MWRTGRYETGENSLNQKHTSWASAGLWVLFFWFVQWELLARWLSNTFLWRCETFLKATRVKENEGELGGAAIIMVIQEQKAVGTPCVPGTAQQPTRVTSPKPQRPSEMIWLLTVQCNYTHGLKIVCKTSIKILLSHFQAFHVERQLLKKKNRC